MRDWRMWNGAQRYIYGEMPTVLVDGFGELGAWEKITSPDMMYSLEVLYALYF
jgi:hypothetical protein